MLFSSKVGTDIAGIKKINVWKEFKPQFLWWYSSRFFFPTIGQVTNAMLTSLHGGPQIASKWPKTFALSLQMTSNSDLSFEYFLFIAIHVALWKPTAACGINPRIFWGSWCFLWLSEEWWRVMFQVQQLSHYHSQRIFFPQDSTHDLHYDVIYVNTTYLHTKTDKTGPLKQSEHHCSPGSGVFHWGYQFVDFHKSLLQF